MPGNEGLGREPSRIDAPISAREWATILKKLKKKSVWLNHGWTFRKRRRSTGHAGWPCTSPSAAAAGGGQKAELQRQGDAAKRVYLLGEGRNWFWQLFLGGSYWENTWSFAELSQLSELHKSMECDCCLMAQKNARYLATDTVLPQQNHSNVVWYDTLPLKSEISEKSHRGTWPSDMDVWCWVRYVHMSIFSFI